MRMFKYKLMLLVMMSVAINFTWANEPFSIVTDPWPPYVYLEEGKAVGIDVDITLAVLNKMAARVIDTQRAYWWWCVFLCESGWVCRH